MRSLPPFTHGNIKKWAVPSRTEVFSLTSDGSGAIGLTNALAVTPDGTAFVSGHGIVRCPAESPCVDFAIGFHAWNAASGASQLSLEAGDIDGLVEAVTFSHGGQRDAFVMSRSNEEQIRVYDYPEFTLQGTYAGHGDGTYCAAFTPDGHDLVAGISRDVSPAWGGLIRIWDMTDGSLVREYTEEAVGSVGWPLYVAVSPTASGCFAYTYDNKVSGSAGSLSGWDDCRPGARARQTNPVSRVDIG